jgi:methionyl-tRNA synthetase
MAAKPRPRDHAMKDQTGRTRRAIFVAGKVAPQMSGVSSRDVPGSIRRRTAGPYQGRRGVPPGRAYNGRTVKDTFYITSAIYYVNDVPHVGHTYEIVACDVIARYHRLRGDRVFFLTGSDEHSQNVAKAAADNGLTPQEWTDRIVPRWQGVWSDLGITNDDWIRTSEPRHVERVQAFVQRLYDRGDVYLGTYEGPYCVSCEEFKQESDVVDGLCPIHRIRVQRLSEDNYFFRLSGYQDALLELYESHPEFVSPEVRRNEVMSFVRGGLKDLSISRPATMWGVPLPWDPKHVVYVWVDALLNYITAPGFGADDGRFSRVWPADVHMIGKDIVRFHCVIWPAMLLAAGLPAPTRVFAHGFLNMGGEKMSKSRGTMVYPGEVLGRFGEDAYRYYLMREVQWGQDGNFSWESMEARYAAELANGLGNLASRVLAMLGSYFDGAVPEPADPGPAADLPQLVVDVTARYDRLMLDVALTPAIAAVWEIVSRANQYLVEKAPWKVAGDDTRRTELASILYAAAETLRILAILISPVMPSAAGRLWDQLGVEAPLQEQRLPEAASWGLLVPGTKTNRGESLFPRHDG